MGGLELPWLAAWNTLVFGGDGEGPWHRELSCSLFFSTVGTSVSPNPFLRGRPVSFLGRGEFPGLWKPCAHLPPELTFGGPVTRRDTARVQSECSVNAAITTRVPGCPGWLSSWDGRGFETAGNFRKYHWLSRVSSCSFWRLRKNQAYGAGLPGFQTPALPLSSSVCGLGQVP